MAAGHRCSYRHNVCQPLQAVIAKWYNCMNISSWIKWRVLFLIIYFIYLSLAVCCYNNEIYIFFFFIYSSMTVCCYNNETKYAAWVAWYLFWRLGFILYIHTVVGGVVNYNYVIYDGRISLCLSSQRMPAATSSDIQLYE